MSRGVWVLAASVPLAAVVAAGAGLGWGLLVSVVLVVFGSVLHREQRRGDRDHLVGQVRGWSTAAPGRRRIEGARRLGALRELVGALNEVGRALDESEELLARERPWRRELVDAIAVPALLFDLDGYLVSANELAVGLVGRPPLSPQPTATQVTGSARLAEAIRDAGRGRAMQELTVALGDRTVGAAVSMIGGEVLVTLQDHTEQQRIEHVRRNFVVNASHELKTPATSIQTLAEALELTITRNPDRVPELVGRLRGEAERLMRMVHDLLSLRRVEEESAAQVVAVDLANLTRDVVADLLDSADQRDIDLSLDAPDHLVVQGDPDDLRLVVRNLVANAIQYNSVEGRVRITLTEEPVSLRVQDDGIGIPERDLERIFERFYRVDVARSRERGGTGLGLSIARHAAERNGASIRATSLVGSGSTFTVTFDGATNRQRSSA